MEVSLEKSKVGKAFKKEAKAVTDHITNLGDEEITKLENDINNAGYVFYFVVFLL